MCQRQPPYVPEAATLSIQGSLIGSAEYAIAHLRTKLLVVSGHTKCGAVTAAVDLIRNAVRRVRQERLSGEGHIQGRFSEAEAPASPGLSGRVASLNSVAPAQRLQSCVIEAAILCGRGCNPV